MDPTEPPESPEPSVVSLCAGSTCGAQVELPGSTSVPSLLVSRSWATAGVAWAWTGGQLYRTSDAGATFSPLSLPVSATIQTLVEDPRGVVYVALAGATPDRRAATTRRAPAERVVALA